MPANCCAVPSSWTHRWYGRIDWAVWSFNEARPLTHREDAAALRPAPRMSLRRSHLIGASLRKVLARKWHFYFAFVPRLIIFFSTLQFLVGILSFIRSLPSPSLFFAAPECITKVVAAIPLAPSNTCPCRGQWQSVSLLLPSAVVLTVSVFPPLVLHNLESPFVCTLMK